MALNWYVQLGQLIGESPTVGGYYECEAEAHQFAFRMTVECPLVVPWAKIIEVEDGTRRTLGTYRQGHYTESVSETGENRS